MADNGDDRDFHILSCPECNFIFFATKQLFPMIERRLGLCADCFKKKMLKDVGLSPDFLTKMFRPF